MVPCSNCLLSSFPTTGKVHGSLARAGKVRGQTPKVSESISGGVWILFFLAQLSQNPGLLTYLISLYLAMSQREGLKEAT